MSEESRSQSLNISGGQLSNVQIGGQAGRDLTANQQQNIGQSASEQLTPKDVAALITQLEAVFRDSDLPEAQTEKAIQHLEVAKEETQAPEPDKEFAAKSLQRATKVLKDAGDTVAAGTGLWNQVEPIIQKIAPWLGVAVGFL